MIKVSSMTKRPGGSGGGEDFYADIEVVDNREKLERELEEIKKKNGGVDPAVSFIEEQIKKYKDNIPGKIEEIEKELENKAASAGDSTKGSQIKLVNTIGEMKELESKKRKLMGETGTADENTPGIISDAITEADALINRISALLDTKDESGLEPRKIYLQIERDLKRQEESLKNEAQYAEVFAKMESPKKSEAQHARFLIERELMRREKYVRNIDRKEELTKLINQEKQMKAVLKTLVIHLDLSKLIGS